MCNEKTSFTEEERSVIRKRLDDIFKLSTITIYSGEVGNTENSTVIAEVVFVSSEKYHFVPLCDADKMKNTIN